MSSLRNRIEMTKSPMEASRDTTTKKIQGHPHKCTGKVMLTFFFDQDYPPSDRLRAVRDNSQCPALLKNLDHPSPSDQIEMTRQAHLWVILLHDNARPNMTNTIMALFQKFKWEVLGHPPYSPDLSPYDYVIFGPLKKALRGKRLTSDDNVKQYLWNWFTMQPREFYETAIHCLVLQCDKCLTSHGQYF